MKAKTALIENSEPVKRILKIQFFRERLLDVSRKRNRNLIEERYDGGELAVDD